MKMPKEQAEKALRIWAQERGRIAEQRDPLVQDAYVSGVNKHQIHLLTGLARTTIDDILKVYEESPLIPAVLIIDPPGCGCTECLTGEYKPLDRASDKDVAQLLLGRAINNLDSGAKFFLSTKPDSDCIHVAASYTAQTWDIARDLLNGDLDEAIAEWLDREAADRGHDNA